MAFTTQQEADLLALLNRGTKKMRDLPEQVAFNSSLFVRVLDEGNVQLSQRDRKMSISLIADLTVVGSENVSTSSNSRYVDTGINIENYKEIFIEVTDGSTVVVGPYRKELMTLMIGSAGSARPTRHISVNFPNISGIISFGRNAAWNLLFARSSTDIDPMPITVLGRPI